MVGGERGKEKREEDLISVLMPPSMVERPPEGKKVPLSLVSSNVRLGAYQCPRKNLDKARNSPPTPVLYLKQHRPVQTGPCNRDPNVGTCLCPSLSNSVPSGLKQDPSTCPDQKSVSLTRVP